MMTIGSDAVNDVRVTNNAITFSRDILHGIPRPKNDEI